MQGSKNVKNRSNTSICANTFRSNIWAVLKYSFAQTLGLWILPYHLEQNNYSKYFPAGFYVHWCWLSAYKHFLNEKLFPYLLGWNLYWKLVSKIVGLLGTTKKSLLLINFLIPFCHLKVSWYTLCRFHPSRGPGRHFGAALGHFGVKTENPKKSIFWRHLFFQKDHRA